MPLQDLIQVAAGTVTGRDHTFGGNLVIGRGNQDAIATAWSADADAFVAVMCDGCSSGEHSEVGAQLGANLILGRLLGWMATADRPPDGVWAFGDYAMLHNGELKRSQFAGNAPPYLGYLLLPADKVRVHQGDLQFRPALTTAPKPDLALTLTTRFATETLAGMVATLEDPEPASPGHRPDRGLPGQIPFDLGPRIPSRQDRGRVCPRAASRRGLPEADTQCDL